MRNFSTETALCCPALSDCLPKRPHRMAPKIVWLKPIRGRYGKTVQRIEATLVAVGEEWCTVELENGERRAARAADVKLVKATNA